MKGKVQKTIEIQPNFKINTIINGLWQLSGNHGKIEPLDALYAMHSYHDAGFFTWDLADHYGFAEDLVGWYLESHQTEIQPKFLTKWVPSPGPMNRTVVEKAIDRSLQRMKVASLDMLQFHWWDYTDENYLSALKILNDLREEGKIRYLSLTNFNTQHLKRVVDLGIPIVSNQIQFSVLDQRPLEEMVPYCEKNGIRILAYGTLGGSLYTERFYMQDYPLETILSTASLQKYMGMVRRWGDWKKFQKFLQTIHSIAVKYQVSMANIALRFILEQPAIAAAIVGVRLSLSEHIQDTLNVYQFKLDAEDHQQIRDAYALGENLYSIIGDCGDEYR
jgi:aryl-alcohol dehydrogenase-like predicted oxidoreductase